MGRYRTILGLTPIEWVAYVILATCVWTCISFIAGCAGQDLAGIKADITGLESTIEKIEARVGTIEDSPQTGLINIAATSGAGLGGYALSTILLIVVWKLLKKAKRMGLAIGIVKRAIDDDDNCHEIKRRIAKHEAIHFGEIATTKTYQNIKDSK